MSADLVPQELEDGSCIVPIEFSKEQISALTGDGLRVVTGTLLQLNHYPGMKAFSLIFTPAVPLLICKECGYVGDTSDSAMFVDDDGTQYSAYQENAYVTRCMNEDCEAYKKIRMISRELVNRNLRKGQRATGEF